MKRSRGENPFRSLRTLGAKSSNAEEKTHNNSEEKIYNNSEETTYKDILNEPFDIPEKKRFKFNKTINPDVDPSVLATASFSSSCPEFASKVSEINLLRVLVSANLSGHRVVGRTELPPVPSALGNLRMY